MNSITALRPIPTSVSGGRSDIAAELPNVAEVPIGDIRSSLTTLREKLVKIGAKVVRHGRYVAFQMAEVAVPRMVFAEILRLIAQLRPPPYPAPT